MGEPEGLGPLGHFHHPRCRRIGLQNDADVHVTLPFDLSQWYLSDVFSRLPGREFPDPSLMGNRTG